MSKRRDSIVELAELKKSKRAKKRSVFSKRSTSNSERLPQKPLNTLDLKTLNKLIKPVQDPSYDMTQGKPIQISSKKEILPR